MSIWTCPTMKIGVKHNMIEEMVAILVLSLIVEYLVKILKPVIPVETIANIPVGLIFAMVIGVTVTMVTDVNIFEILGFQLSNIMIGQILTGLIVSGGSGFVHELFEKLRNSRNDIINRVE